MKTAFLIKEDKNEESEVASNERPSYLKSVIHSVKTHVSTPTHMGEENSTTFDLDSIKKQHYFDMMAKAHSIENPNLLSFTEDNQNKIPTGVNLKENGLHDIPLQNNVQMIRQNRINGLINANIANGNINSHLPFYNAPTQPGIQIQQNFLPNPNDPNPFPLPNNFLPTPTPVMIDIPMPQPQQMSINPNSGTPLPPIAYDLMNPSLRLQSKIVL